MLGGLCVFLVLVAIVFILANDLATVEAEEQLALHAVEQVDFVLAALDEGVARGAVRSVLHHNFGQADVARVDASTVDILLLQLLLLCLETPARFILLKVLVRVVLGQDSIAVPAEVHAAVLARHLVAALRFLDWERALWALLRAVLDVQHTHALFNEILSSCDVLVVFAEELSCFLTARVRVILLHALSAELEVTLGALAKVAALINLSWRATIRIGAPCEIMHLVDCLADRKVCALVNKLLFKTDISEIMFQNERLASPVIVDAWTGELIDLPIFNDVLAVLANALFAESVAALLEEL